AGGGVVLEGRDTGTTVFPGADLKVFMVADARRRALRRREDLRGSGIDAPVEDLQREIEERDRRDSTRVESPLRKAEDAVEIDTSGLTVEEQVEAVVALARRRMEETGESECGSR
ncbi:MAG: (d)CMP kinase, partial [Bacteroidota bacterium]